jgi:hypothetical protein
MANPNDLKDPKHTPTTPHAGAQQPTDRSVEPNRQGISNRPGDEEPGSGVDAAPGNDGNRK